ncbi:hypothetical protein RCL_jg5281.t1 [Rhizophagus clarus]|uniref:Uncharacterized protein n=1 Tax=Rhizophagus clarus TaxID=94130 RepID=A0A8H3QR35_9GLOM|nr:hypothetical protein RCL_jg5281.t1 [Rhizophagus clarus]
MIRIKLSNFNVAISLRNTGRKNRKEKSGRKKCGRKKKEEKENYEYVRSGVVLVLLRIGLWNRGVGLQFPFHKPGPEEHRTLNSWMIPV